MALPAAFRKRAKPNIVAFTVTVLVAVGAMDTADLLWRRQDALAQAGSRARNLSLVLAEYVRGSFVSADAALRQLAVHNTRVGGPTASHEVWDPILASAKAALPEVGSFNVTDAAGTITHSNVRAIVGSSRRDNYIFKQLSTTTRDDLILDRPFLSITQPAQFLIPIGRRLTTADGRFAGMVVATVLPESFRTFFGTLDLGRGGVITVFHPDGVILFREPSTSNPINEAAADSALFARAKLQPAGEFRGAVQPGGARYVSAYQTISSPPLVVSVSLLENAILTDWRRERRVSVVAFGALALTLTVLVLVLLRVVDARERAERELADVQRQEAERLRDANERLAQALGREQRARHEVEEASYMKDEFLMTVSHELRTPLTAIYGWVRVLASREMPRAEQAKALAAVERNALAQTRLIDDLLDVSRAISGKLRLESRPVSLPSVISAAAETLTPAMTARRLELALSLDEEVDPIPGDPDRLQQVVWNLLSNAIKFTPEGGRIQIRLARAGDSHAEIVVSDTGTGIAPDFLPFVFDRFRQADAGSRRRYGGLGLGLAIVRHIVELHGGTVGVESAGEGQGATFRVRLPIRTVRADAAAQVVPARAGAAEPEPPTLEAVRILVVDDEPDARELFGQILEAAGAKVRTAGSAEEALKILASEGADVLVSDIEMPKVDGYELLRLVMADSRVQRDGLIAVALTAYARAADRRRALEAGFRAHLAKPVDPAVLVSTIAGIVKG
jgi:signal transduction histidine kinase/CheY-like chemotaxis protein